MGVRGYEATADGSDFDQNWTEDVAKAVGRVTNVALYPASYSSYLIFLDDSTYYARNGRTGVIDDSNATLLTLTQAINDSLTAATGGIIYLKELEDPGTTLDNDVLVVEDYQGRRRIYSNQGQFMSCPLLAADPATGGWGASEEGYNWYNTTSHEFKFWNGTAVKAWPVVGGGDADAIHDNVAAEISAIAEKAAPIAADLIVIEDSAAANVKKRVQLGNLPSLGDDTNAIHDDEANEISALVAKAVPVSDDILIMEDSAAAFVKKKVLISSLPAAGGTYKLASYYIIYKSGANYIAMDEDGNLDFSDADAATVIQDAVDVLEADDGGKIILRDGSYDFSDEVLITGDGYTITKTIIIQGQGMYSTTINTAENKYGFRLLNAANAFLYDMGFVMPASNAQSAIFGDDGGGDDVYSLFRGELRNLYLSGGGSTDDLACVHLQNPFFWHWSGINRIEVDGTLNATGSCGIHIENTDAAGYRCDGEISGYFHIRTSKDSQVGIRGSATNNKASHLKLSAHIYVYCGGVTTNTKALELSDCKFWDVELLDSEGAATLIDLADCFHMGFKLGYVHVRDAGTVFEVPNTNQFIWVKRADTIDIFNTEAATVFNDACGDARSKSIYENMYIEDVGTPTFTVHSETILRKIITWNSGLSEKGGTATILNGNASIVVAHGLMATPQNIRVLGQHAETTQLYVHTIGAANFTITTAVGNVTANRDVYWMATVNKYL